MGRFQKRKGYRGERNLVQILKKAGFEAQRIPLSGSTSFAKGDILIEKKRMEVKWRKDGFKQLYKWLENVDYLALKADRKEYLVVMRLSEFIELLGGVRRERKKENV